MSASGEQTPSVESDDGVITKSTLVSVRDVVGCLPPKAVPTPTMKEMNAALARAVAEDYR